MIKLFLYIHLNSIYIDRFNYYYKIFNNSAIIFLFKYKKIYLYFNK